MKYIKRLYKRILHILPIIVIPIIFTSCTENKIPMEENDAVISPNIGDFEILELPLFDRPYNHYSSPLDLTAKIFTDSNGVLMWDWKGNSYYHPVNLSFSALHNIFSYFTTQNSEYLSRAEKYMQKLVEVSFREDGNIYFPYNFDIFPHGNGYGELFTPWYSGMAQGVGLSALVRLYNITGKTGYLVPPGDAEAIAERIIKLIEEPSLRQQLGKGGRKFVIDNFEWESCASKMERIYNDVII